MKRSFTISAAAVAAAGLLVLGASSAAAHVSVSASTTEAGSYSVLTFAVPHGCGDSATTALAIQVPDALHSVTPTVNPGWDIEQVTEPLDPPADDGHGGRLTERVAQVVYTAHEPLPTDHRDTFELSVRLPDTPGETLTFPVVQSCEEGEAPWVQVPADGQDAGELDMPAPVITLTAAPDVAVERPAAAADGLTDTAADDAGDGGDAGAPPVVSWVALGAGVTGMLLGGLALTRARRTG